MKMILEILALGLLSLFINGEIYAHGLGVFLIIPLLLFYILFMVVMTFARSRFKLNYRQIFVFGAILGLLLEIFYTKSIFYAPFFLGVNWFSVIIQELYWGMSATLPFYVLTEIKNTRGLFFNKQNLAICGYLIAELIFGTFRMQTTWIWVITGLLLGIIVLPSLLKKQKAKV
jgi:hypothetical protein